MTDDEPTYDEVMQDIAIRSAANGGPHLDDVMRAIRASHADHRVAITEIRGQLGRIVSHLESESGRTRLYVESAIAACRDERSAQTAEAEREAATIVREREERRLVRQFMNDSTKRLVILLLFVALSVTAYFLLTRHDVLAAQVTAILALVTPFLLLLYRRG